jgi:hypothetical protein
MQVSCRFPRTLASFLLVAAALAGPALATEQWQHSSEQDAMRGTQTHFAELYSTTRLAGSGGQPVALTILVRRAEAKKSDEVLLAIVNAQFSCAHSDCYALVKFGAQAPKKYALSRSTDMSNIILFVERAADFLGQLRRSPTVIIEVDVLRGGRQQFAFEVPPLKLPDRPTRASK